MSRRALLSVACLLVASLGLAGSQAGCCGRAGQRAAAPAEARGHAPPDPARPQPRLVVLVVIDQLPSWSFERDRALFTGGMARLIEDGLYVPRADIPYAVTYTAPGHAALATGAPPSVTRIPANQWYVPAAGERGLAIDDAQSPVFFMGEGEPSPQVAEDLARGASGARLAVDGLADVLRRETGGAGKSVAVSLKDRAAIFVLGRRPDLAVWYDAAQQAMTTSRYYAPAPPGWLRELGREHPVEPRLREVWKPLPGIDYRAATGIPDAAGGEVGPYGLPGQFPYRAADADSPGKAVAALPLGNELVLETALAAVEAEDLGADEVPDALALSFSAHDYAGHAWGQESWERLDMLLRLDRDLGEFLGELDRRVGAGRYAVVLTSDHGATRQVERSREAGKAAFRIAPGDVAEVAGRAAEAVLGPPPPEASWVAYTSSYDLHVSPAFRRQSPGRREAALEAMVRAIDGMEGMAYADRVDRMTGDCAQRSGLEARACRSVVPGITGEIFFAAGEDSLISSAPTGTTHGSPNPDDSTVPIVVYAPGRAAQEARPAAESPSLLQVAPTAAELLGIPAPPAATAPPLGAGP